MNDLQNQNDENRLLRARVEKMQGQLEDLAQDNRDLHRQMAVVIDHLGASEPDGNRAEAPVLEIPPPAAAEGLMTRGVRKALRVAAGAVRTLRRASDPGADMVRVLAAVQDPSPPTVLPTVGEDIILDGADGIAPAVIDALELPWLFGLEAVDAALIRIPGATSEILAVRRDLQGALHGKGLAGLVQAASELRRPVIAKRLPCTSAPADREWLLHRIHVDGGVECWHNEAYVVGLPRGVRRVELRLNTKVPPILPERATDLLILISAPLVEGLELRMGAGIAAATGLSREIVSFAPWTEIGSTRLQALASDDHPVHDFGSVLQPSTWQMAVEALLRRSAPKTLWAIGSSEDLGFFVDQARHAVPSIRVVAEAVDGGRRPMAADETIVRTEGQRGQLEGTPGIGALHLAPTPLGRAVAPGSSAIRRTLGVPADATLVVVAGDLTAGGRPEDAAAVARTLGEREDIWFRVIGRGPLASAVDDLGRLFGLDRFAVSQPDHSLEEIVAAADVVCCPGQSEVLPPAAAIAVASGVPMVAPSSGEAADMAGAGAGRIHLGGRVGDTEALAAAVLAAIDAGPSESGAGTIDGTKRDAECGRIYRETLGGQGT